MRSKNNSLSTAVLPVVEFLEERRLMSAALTLVNPSGLPSSDRLIFNRIENLDPTVANVVHDTNVLKLQNTGDSPLTIGSLTVTGPWIISAETDGFTQSDLTIPVGGEVDLTLKFTQSSLPAHSGNQTNFTSNPNGGAAIFGALTISNTNDPAVTNRSVTLAGYWQNQSEHSNEPNLTTITNLLAGYDTVIATPPAVDLTNGSTPTYYGQEVVSSSWVVADSSMPISMQELADFHTQGNVVHTYWYSAATQNSHLLLTSVGNQGQTLLPTLANGSLVQTSFLPSGPFGFRVDNEYSDDSINLAAGNTGGAGHHFRFYPLIDHNGNAVPNTWIVAMDYAVIQSENFDFNDNVFIVSNMTPATVPPAPTDLAATNVANPVLSWTGVTYANLAGYNVYSSSSPTGTFTKLTSSPISTTNFTDPNVAPGGQTVYYRVTAVDSNSSLESAPATANANAPGGPVTHSDTFSAYAGTPLSVNVLANDTDPTGTINPASVVVVTPPTHGTAVVDMTTGAVVYTANAGYAGPDSFTYQVSDNNTTLSAVTTASGTVLDLTQTAPVAVSQTDNTLVNVPLAQLTPVATDIAGNALGVASVTLVTQPAHGTASVNSDGVTITYTPTTNFVGPDSFTYFLVGAANVMQSNTTTLSLNVGAEISSAKGANKEIDYTDNGGTPGIIKLNKGTADVYFTSSAVYSVKKGKVTIAGDHLNISNIIASNTTSASVLSIATLHNTGAVRVNAITDAGTLGKIAANNVVIGGTIDIPTITVGGLASLSIQTGDNLDLQVGSGYAPGFVFTAKSITDSLITSAVPIKSLKVASWSNTQSGNLAINAPSIGTITSAGNFDSDLNLSGTGTAVPTLNSAKILGQVDLGFWDITGGANNISANSVGNSWGAHVSGALKSVTVKSGGLPADISAGTLSSLKVTGDLSGNITAGATKTIKVTGNITGSTIEISGNLTTISAASLTDSILDVGSTLLPSDVTTATAANIGASAISSVHLGAFSNSNIVAAQIKSASLGAVTTDNNGNAEGLAAKSYQSITASFSNMTLHAGAAQLTSEQILLTFAASKGFSDATFGDFQIAFVS